MREGRGEGRGQQHFFTRERGSSIMVFFSSGKGIVQATGVASIQNLFLQVVRYSAIHACATFLTNGTAGVLQCIYTYKVPFKNKSLQV